MSRHIWTVKEAKAKLSEILRLAEEQGPQRIGTRRGYMIVTEQQWKQQTRPPLGRWLLDNLPQGDPLELPDRADAPRPNPFDTGSTA